MSPTRPRALVTLPDVAAPADSGRRLRSWSTLEGLGRLFDMDVVFLAGVPAESTTPLSRATESARWLSSPPQDDTFFTALTRVTARRMPWALAHQDWRGTRRHILEWSDPAGYDFAWYGAIGHCLALAPHVSSTRSAVDIDDVESVKWRGYLRRRPARPGEAVEYVQRVLELPMWRRAEKRVARLANALVLSAPDDVAECAGLGIHNTYVIPNTYPDPGRIRGRTPAHPPVLALVANFVHGPNREAAHTLVREVLPAVRQVVAETQVRLIGRGATAIAELADEPGVDLVGAVEEIAPHLQDVLATVMPISFGGGTRLKVLEAFALGIPVISTSLGVAGLGAVDHETFLVAETPEDYVRSVLQLLGDPDLGRRLGDAGRRLYEKSFTPEASADSIAALVKQLSPTEGAPC